jgi:hypothetical protein
MKLTSIIGAMVLTGLVGGSGSADVTAAAGPDKVTVTGCAVKGNGDGDGFLLANNTAPTRVLYWLDDDDHDVAKLMGQLVEVTGEVKGDIKRGEIKAERENGMVELEINAAGRKANVKLADVPSAIGAAGSVKDREVELPYVVRKLDVKSAKSLAATCK